MIDLLTVVFRDELPILKVQAQSIDLHCQNLNSRSIFVMVNDDNSVADLIDPGWWGSLSSKVRIIPRSYFSVKEWCPDGWVSQQVLKIVGSTLSYNDWTLVLDAKTIVVSNLNQNDLVQSANRANQTVMGINPAWGPFKQVVDQLFDIKLDFNLSPGGVPFLFHNNSVRSMHCEIVKRTNTNFPDWFQKQSCPSEFLLYSGYIKYSQNNLSENLAETSPYRPVNICHSEFDQYDEKINMMNTINPNTVSIHRRTKKSSQYMQF